MAQNTDVSIFIFMRCASLEITEIAEKLCTDYTVNTLRIIDFSRFSLWNLKDVSYNI